LNFILIIWRFFCFGPSWKISTPVIWANISLPSSNLSKFRFTPLLIWANFGLPPMTYLRFCTVKIHEGPKPKIFKLQWRNPIFFLQGLKLKNDLHYREDKTLLTQIFTVATGRKKNQAEKSNGRLIIWLQE